MTHPEASCCVTVRACAATRNSQSELKRVAIVPAAPIFAFDVSLPGPIDVAASLELFRRNGDDLLDRWDGVNLVRTLRVGERVVAYAAAATGSITEPALRVTVADSADKVSVEDAIRSTLVLPTTDFARLCQADPVIAQLDQSHVGLRPVRQFDLFAALLRCVSAQQVNLRWAATTRRRLAEAFGERHIVGEHVVFSLCPTRLAVASVAEIRALQFTTRKSEYIVGIAAAVASGRLRLEELTQLPDDEVIARLTVERGIGLWTAEWILARTLCRPRVVAGDLGVRKAVGRAYLGAALPSEAEVRLATAHWGESALIAQSLLLQSLSAGGSAT